LEEDKEKEEGTQAAVTKTTATVEEEEAEMIAAVDIGGMNNGTPNDQDANKDGGFTAGDCDGDGDDGAMLANESVCILSTQEVLECSWQIARGGIHSRFSNRLGARKCMGGENQLRQFEMHKSQTSKRIS